MIIHIIGAPGSGKTTLGTKLAKHKEFVVIDTDDIFDKNAMKIINTKKYDNLFSHKRLRSFFALLDRMNNIDMRRIITHTQKHNNILIIVGHTIDITNANYKYYIKMDADTNYKYFTNRTLNDFCKNHNAIRKLLNSNINPYKKYMILKIKYKIRGCIPMYPYDIKLSMKRREKNARELKYKIMTSDKIYNDIIKLI